MPGSPVRPPRLRSPLARAVLPVLGGIVVIGLIFLATWIAAALISRNGGEATSRLAPPVFPMGSATRHAPRPSTSRVRSCSPTSTRRAATARSSSTTRAMTPPGAGSCTGATRRTRRPACPVTQVRHTARFTDCDGRVLDVTQLARPDGVHPTVVDSQRLEIDLRAVTQADG